MIKLGFLNPSIGDFLTINPLFRRCDNIICEFFPSEKNKIISELLHGICPVMFTENPTLEHKSIEVYAVNKYNPDPFQLASKKWLYMYGIDNTFDYFPKIKIFDYETKNVIAKLSKYKNPIFISPFTTNYHIINDFHAQQKFLSFDKWNHIIEKLNNKYEIINISLTEFNHPCVDNSLKLNLREAAIAIKLVNKIITLDNGHHHLATSVDANLICLVPDNDGHGYYRSNYCYFDNPTTKYITFSNIDKIFNYV